MEFAQVAAFLEKANRFFFVRCLFEEANLFSLRGQSLYVALRVSYTLRMYKFPSKEANST